MYSLILWRKCSPLLFIVMVLLLAVPGVMALNDTAPLTVTPASLTITGDTSGVVTRTLVLQAGEDISDLTFKPLDLQDPDTGQTYPATMVSTSTTSRSTTVPEALQNATISDLFFYLMKYYAEAGPLYPVYLLNPTLLLSTQTFTLQGMQAGGSEDVTLQFVLQGAEPGRFSGEYLFTYQDGGTTRLPVTMTLRDTPWWPAFLLAVTVAFSFILFEYAQLWKRKDEIYKNVLIIQGSINRDEDLKKPNESGDPFPNPFKVIIQENIDLALRFVALDSTDIATKHQEAAIEYWNKWNAGKDIWLKLLFNCNIWYHEIKTEAQMQFLGLIRAIPTNKSTTEAEKGLKDLHDANIKTTKYPHEKPPEERIPEQLFPKTKPEKRLWLYQFGSLTVTAIILFLLGLSELYYSNPTFGASASDYITLILWGLFVGPVSGAIAGKASTKITGV